jgi:hypothetical protein
VTPEERKAFNDAVAFYPGHTGAIGVLLVPGEKPMFIKSGVDGGPWGGTQRGGIPRGTGEAFTQGGPSQGNIATHVEGHAAAIMWQRGFTRGTLVVSDGMCGICSRNMPTALPGGAEVTVVSEAEGRTIVRSTRAPRSSGSPGQGPPALSGGPTPGKGAQAAATLGALAGGLAVFESWASQRSMMNVYYDSLDEMERRKSEIDSQRRMSPYECAVVNVYYYIMNEHAPAEVMRLYEFKGIDIGGESIAGKFLLDRNWHGYSLRFDALSRKPDADSPKPAPRQNWHQRYDALLGSLYTSGGNVADPIASLQLVNGLSMPDILNVLKKLKAEEPIAFDKLQQGIDWPSAQGRIGGPRLKAAFVAVRFSENGGSATFSNYVGICKDYGLLPQDQQKDIERLLAGEPAAAAQMDTPVGKWRVKVSKWVWIYTFDGFGNVAWVDPLNGLTGKGRWKVGKDTMTTTWLPSKTVEDWKFPLSEKGQTGVARMSDGVFPLNAEMI